MNKKIIKYLMTSLLVLGLVSCGKDEKPIPTTVTTSETVIEPSVEDPLPEPGAEETRSNEITIDEFELGPLNISMFYTDPVELSPSGIEPTAAESSIFLELYITANDLGAKMGFDLDTHVPSLLIHAWIVPADDDFPDAPITLMPINSSFGPHYGANIKLGEPGQYKVKLKIVAPDSNIYLSHASGPAKVEQPLWTEDLAYEGDHFNWQKAN